MPLFFSLLEPLDSPNSIFFWLGAEAIVGFLWIFALIRAQSKIQTSAFFPVEHPLLPIEFRRYLFNSMLTSLIVAFILVIASRHDVHYPIYRSSIAILRLILVCFITGLLFGLWSWALIKINMARDARFHRPDLTTWKEFRFWGPKKRKMTSEERTTYLQKMDASDYLKLVGFSILILASFPFILLWLDLMINAPLNGFTEVCASFLKDLMHVEIVLVGIAVVLGSLSWFSKRLFVWLGWANTLV